MGAETCIAAAANGDGERGRRERGRGRLAEEDGDGREEDGERGGRGRGAGRQEERRVGMRCAPDKMSGSEMEKVKVDERVWCPSQRGWRVKSNVVM